jgi:hypothetical protein
VLVRLATSTSWVILSALAVSGCIDASQRTATCPVGPTSAGAAASSSGAAPKVCSGTMRAAAEGPIDDFEDGDTQLSKTGGRDGYWFASKDPNGSTIDPSPLKPADEVAGASKKAMHVTGQTSGAKDAWGVLLGANFVGKGFYDGSKFAGITFRAKVSGSSTKKVRVKLGDVNTHPDGSVCKSCWNHFGQDITLTTDWQTYTVSFAQMKQEAGWGDRRDAITPAQLISINWSVGPGQTFDLWIDDVAFAECG